MIVIAGAYPAAPRRLPSQDREFTDADDEFTAALVKHAEGVGLGGLELAWHDGGLHAREAAHLRALPSSWRHVVTTIPDTMVTWRNFPSFGLASSDDSGRRAALDRLATLRDHVEQLTLEGALGSVAAVLVHSAPGPDRDGSGSRRALAASLREVAQWDWGGAHLLVEHCDSGIATHTPAKGFLPLADELTAVDDAANLATPVGLLVNWGRSAIEGRSRHTPLDHVTQAAASGHLRGVIFSGVAAREDGEAWLDNHLPTSDLNAVSLMRPSDIADTLVAAAAVGADLLVAGVKVTAAPGSLTPTDRAGDVVTTVGHVTQALAMHS